jgi:hypothetical protein
MSHLPPSLPETSDRKRVCRNDKVEKGKKEIKGNKRVREE